MDETEEARAALARRLAAQAEEDYWWRREKRRRRERDQARSADHSYAPEAQHTGSSRSSPGAWHHDPYNASAGMGSNLYDDTDLW